jgi:hypothetical protein
MSDSNESGAWLVGKSDQEQIFLQVSSLDSCTSMTLGLDADEAELIANQLIALVKHCRAQVPSTEKEAA